MRKLVTALLGAFCTLAALGAQAQYTFTTLAPYQQDFNSLGKTQTTFNADGTHSAIPGIILGYQVSSPYTAYAGNIYPNDGSTTVTSVYNFGTSGADDRGLGGIAGGFSGNSGIGYITIRLKNGTSVTIRNLDVRYAIEQWYNTAKTTNANFEASYRKYASTAALTSSMAADMATNTGWTMTPELDQAAPATGGILGQVDGNSTTYRRTAQKRLLDVNMAPGEEVLIRLKYVFNPDTNGNGISVDDVVIYPETNVLYSNDTGKLNEAGTWSQNADNSSPLTSADFSAANYTYFVRGTNTASRLSGTWNVDGPGSRVVVGTDATAATLLLAAADAMTTTLDLSKNSTLKVADPLTGTNLALTLGSAATGSTVEYVATGTQNLLPGTYANLTLAGGNAKFLKGHVTVGGTLTLSRTVSLATYNLTLLREGTLVRNTNGQVQANGVGSFRQTVRGGAAASLLFPMALTSAAADYLPVTITAGASDKDETYRVQVVGNVYTTYGTSGSTPATYANSAGSTTAPTTDNLNATWYIGHETATPVAATIRVGWVESSREGSRFAVRRDQAYLDHYTGSSNTWDASPAERGATLSGGVWYVSRSGVNKFSPFAITANSNGPLPVQLTRFEASRAGSTVACSWTTASELNNSYFVVERSPDGVAFEALGRVAGQGTSATTRTYRFVDARPAAGLAYYRLRQVDADGTASFSAVVAVAGGVAAPAAIAAQPNPGPGRFELQATFEAAGTVQATVLDVLGRPVLQASYPVEAGPAALPLDLSAQPAGVYLVRLQGAGTTATVRLLKQ